jgi:hypothetical protein
VLHTENAGDFYDLYTRFASPSRTSRRIRDEADWVEPDVSLFTHVSEAETGLDCVSESTDLLGSSLVGISNAALPLSTKVYGIKV